MQWKLLYLKEGAPVRHSRRWLRNWEDQWSVPGIQELSASCDPSEPVCIFVEKRGHMLGFFVEKREKFFFTKDFAKHKRISNLTSRVPWAPQDGGGMVSGRGGEFGPEFWKMSHMKINNKKNVKVVTGDSDKLFGPDAGIFAYNGSELASWKSKN